MSEAERKLDWPKVKADVEALGVALPANALPFWFGDSARMARELGELVAAGTKRATAGLVWSWEAATGRIPIEGQIFVVLDWEGEALAVIRYTRVEIVPFDQVDADFAATEGEGDGSLEWWRDAHWRFFSSECERLGKVASQDMPVVCQCFDILWPTP